MLESKSKKLLVSCAIVTLSCAAGAFADDCAPMPVCPPKPCCEPVVCPPMPVDCCERNICTPTGVITPRVDRIKGNAMDWVVSGDYTYWTARQNSNEFAATLITQGPGATQGAGQGSVYRPDNKWVSGFKVGLGTDFCHDGWDIYAEYTWFKSTNSKTTPGEFSTTGALGNVDLVDGFWNVNGGANGAMGLSFILLQMQNGG